MARRSAGKSRLEAARERMYRDLVFESAEHVFARNGFDDATMQEIAAEAGISLKTLYATCPGKNELYAEIQTVRGGEFVETVTKAMEGVDTALGTLEAGVQAYVHFLVEHPDFLRIHLHEGRAWGLRPDRGDESWRAGVEGFASVIARGIEEGVLYEGDPEMMAMTGIAVMQVALARYAEGIGEEQAHALAEEILTSLRRLLCKPDVLERVAWPALRPSPGGPS
jgi:AcrR family transcriptional regulator